MPPISGADSGTATASNGTLNPITKKANTKSRPGKRITASAKPASTAITSPPAVVRPVTASEFSTARPNPVPNRPVRLSRVTCRGTTLQTVSGDR